MKDIIKIGDTVVNNYGCVGVVTKREGNGTLFVRFYGCADEHYNEKDLKLRYNINKEDSK